MGRLVARGALARQRPRAVRVVDGAIARLARLRRRLGAAGGPGAEDGAGYGGLWRPRDEAEARRLILNDADPEAFEASGRADAERLAPLAGGGAVVLDMGCGIGRVARYVAPSCRTLWAVDASEAMLGHARRRLADLANVRFARCDGTRVPAVPDDAVDLAYSLITLQHLEREDAFALLRELRRMVRPGGRIYVTFPNLLSDVYLAAFLDQVDRGEVANPARARAYTPQEVERLLPAAGFAIERLDAGVEIAAVGRG
jgi:ubiquinone/menaquinone biosynthesis C-methylase UbiE